MSTGVVVAVPAHDEAHTVVASLRSIRASVDHAHRLGVLQESVIELVAHRCTDATATLAHEELPDAATGRVTKDSDSTSVGEVRDRAARRGLAHLETPPSTTWVLSTDADTVVGPTWVADILQAAARWQVVGVVGLAPLDRWEGSPHGKAAYARLLAQKMRGEAGLHQHDHVYGANLALRGDVYLAVGGFPAVSHGEDQSLVDAVLSAGYPLLRSTDIRVVTSGRLRGRATGGLADRLRDLESSAAQRPAVLRAP